MNEEKTATRKRTCSGGSDCESKRGGGFFMGGALMLFGGAFLAEHLGYLGGISAWKLWPIILLWGGLVKIGARRSGGGFTGGLVLLAVGATVLAHNFGYVDLRWSLVWPVLLLIFGVLIFTATLRTPSKKRKKSADEITTTNTFESRLLMAGREDEIHSKEFERADVSAVMGGLELDMRNAEIKGEEAVLHVKLVMGGMELWIPEHWEVISRCSPVMGGIENKTRRHVIDSETPPKRLIIEGSIVMGGIEIRN
ncbi:MAG: hypothetical protein JXX29_05265 [Deltaproteobacteria bacterium]|nr:hypothetical protein [Deltaproteobacteria bacterium]MBN2671057.1 hypothetical protein [Deltaproteobacteria bacterium]